MDKSFWWIVTYWGTSGLLLPASLLLLWGWWFSGARPAVYCFVSAMAAGCVLALTSKIAFLGWGIGIRAVDFTGFSGHAMLATAVLPLLAHCLPWPQVVRRARYGLRYAPALLGYGMAAMVAFSRVELRAHSVSESLAGWLLGGAISGLTLHKLRHAPLQSLRHPALWLAPLALLGSLHSPLATYIPTRKLEVQIALLLSGRDKPSNRMEWQAAPDERAERSERADQ